MRVCDVMTSQPACATARMPLEQVANMMVEFDCGAIPIVEENSRRVIGIVTDRDIACRAVAKGMNPIGMSADQIMSPSPRTVDPNDDFDEALRKMESCQVRRLPVVDSSGRLLGMVAQADIARMAAQHHTAELVRDISQPATNAACIQ